MIVPRDEDPKAQEAMRQAPRSMAGPPRTKTDTATHPVIAFPSGAKVAIPYHPSTGALQLLIGSTGIKAEGEGEGEWFAKKHGPLKHPQWRKVHLGIDADTLEIRAIEIQVAESVIPPCCQNHRARSPLTRLSTKWVQTVLTTLGPATRLSPRAPPMRHSMT